MALTIHTNYSSLLTQTNLNKTNNALAVNQQRLGTGLRINAATSVRCRHYSRFADYLFANGFDVITYDYQNMAAAGITGVIEPAFWQGQAHFLLTRREGDIA